jgi:hypothetical protein
VDRVYFRTTATIAVIRRPEQACVLVAISNGVSSGAMRSWQGFLNSPFGLLISGFALTTLAGGFLSSWIQRATWNRQTRVELFRQRYQEGTKFLDELSDHIGQRFFAMQRLAWSLKDAGDKERDAIEKEYFEVIATWNASLRTYRNKIRLLVSETQADRFLDYRDDYRQDPLSLRYIFVKAHNAVMGARSGTIDIAAAQLTVDELNWACSNYLEAITTSFVERATTLQLLHVPETNTGGPLKAPRDPSKGAPNSESQS